MNWLALSPVEVAGLWAALAALALWLYLHHRRPQHRKVSTLLFWGSVQPIAQPRRRKLREPWALLAQVLFLLLLILALANPRWGVRFEGRSVVIVLDTSIWSQAHPAGESPWIDRERVEALHILNSLPWSDRVLLISAGPDAPPILPFSTDRAALRSAIEGAQTSSEIADVPRALEIGKAALAASRRGLLVYVGPGLVDEKQQRSLDEFRASIESPTDNAIQPQFLVRLVSDDSNPPDRGITRLSLRRDAEQPDRWHLLTQLKNYGNAKTDVVLNLSVNGQPLGQRSVALAPNELFNAENEFVWDKGGFLQAEIVPSDMLDADNRATVNLPAFHTVHVALFTGANSSFAKDLRSVLSSNPYVQMQLTPQGAGSNVSPDVSIYQGKNLPAKFDSDSIWFLAGPSSPDSHSVRVIDWDPQHPVTRWVRTHDVSIRNPAVLTVLPTDTVLAKTEGTPPAPLILAREQNGRRVLIVGFDPQESNFPEESAFPLLMAGAVEWMTHSVDEAADSLSTGELDLPEPVAKIIAPSGKEVPFARNDPNVHLLTTETGIYRVLKPNRETSFAINSPLLPSLRMTPTPVEEAGVEGEPLQAGTWDLWRLLVLLAIIALWLEWWLYYAARERQRSVEDRKARGNRPLQKLERELEEREESEFRDQDYVAKVTK